MLSQIHHLSTLFPTFNDLPLNSRNAGLIDELCAVAQGRRAEDLLFYGPNGSGKTALAQLIAYWNKNSLGEQSIPSLFDAHDINPAKLRTLVQASAFDGDHDWVIIDELDKIKREKQTPLLTMIGGSSTRKFIFTANNLAAIDIGLESRCLCLEIIAPTAQDLLPFALKRLATARKTYSDAQVLSEMKAHEGDLRSMRRRLDRLIDP